MTDNYDRIARFYDVDMARNMPFDDVGFYIGQCASAQDPVLELGCGNGRILLALLRAGVDAVGVDASTGMLDELRVKAAAATLPARVIRMDVRRLALRPKFAVVLCPYSLITYMADATAPARMLGEAARVLLPGGRLIVDAFVPRPLVTHDEFRQDYVRPFGDGRLARWKRIRALDAATNRIERRYQWLDGHGSVVEQIDVAETIRPFSPEALREAVAAAGFEAEQEWWNYGSPVARGQAQFFTLAARAR